MQGLKKAELFPLQPPPAGCYTLAEVCCGSVFHLHLKRQHRLLLQTRNCEVGPISGHSSRETH